MGNVVECFAELRRILTCRFVSVGVVVEYDRSFFPLFIFQIHNRFLFFFLLNLFNLLAIYLICFKSKPMFIFRVNPMIYFFRSCLKDLLQILNQMMFFAKVNRSKFYSFLVCFNAFLKLTETLFY